MAKGLIGSGKWKIAPYDAAVPFGKRKFREIGETTSAPYTFNTDKKTLPSGSSITGGNSESYERVSEVFLELDIRHFIAENWALGLWGDATAVAATPITGEEHIIRAGAFIPFDRIVDITVAPVLKKGATVISVNDYKISRGGATIAAAISTVGVVEDDVITVDYTPVAGFEIETLVNSAPEVSLYFEGYNNNVGKPRDARVWRAKVGLAANVENIGQDYNTLKLRFEILEDDTITGAGLSKFIKLGEPLLA